MRKLKIVQVLPELNTGGVERGTIELGNFLAAQGHESVVISNGGAQEDILIDGGSRHIRMPVHRKSWQSLLQVRPMRSLLLREKPDVVHYRSRIPGWITYLAWRKIPDQRRPLLISTVHGFNSVNKYSEIMTRGEKVIAVSDSVRDYIVKNYVKLDADRVTVIHRGVDEKEYFPDFKPSEAWWRSWYEQFPHTKGKKWFTLPGRITRLKGHEAFIDFIASSDRGCHGLIVGGVHPKKKAYDEELRRMVKERGLSERITFTGNRTDLREILSASSVVFSLSTKPESFGRTTLEALALGTPVIGYDHGGVGEILEHCFPAGKIPLDQQSFPNDLWQSVLSAKITGTEKFTLRAMLEKTLALYGESGSLTGVV